jgi:hypothetical protein
MQLGWLDTPFSRPLHDGRIGEYRVIEDPTCIPLGPDPQSSIPKLDMEYTAVVHRVSTSGWAYLTVSK